ncbi:MAG TPA: hypothetical protein VMZ52_09825 [Bryobacteraceae bacterium]|nr:hypothetical protein [Bryobacteraceae bacterium]
MTTLRTLLLMAAICGSCLAQDTFEIQVYEYETVPKNKWNLETHLNYIGSGTRSFEGTVAPTNNQFHMTYELTRGLSENWELAGYLVTARRVGYPGPIEFAGWRVRPRWKAPEQWNWPVKFSMSLEVGFPRKMYEDSSPTIELRPVFEKRFGKFQLDVNPVLARALHGPGTDSGWEFEPAIRAAYQLTRRFEPSLEYYGATGPVFGPLPRGEQVHLFFPGADIQINENVVWNVGVGWAATPAGNQLTYKMRLGVLFGSGVRR